MGRYHIMLVHSVREAKESVQVPSKVSGKISYYASA